MVEALLSSRFRIAILCYYIIIPYFLNIVNTLDEGFVKFARKIAKKHCRIRFFVKIEKNLHFLLQNAKKRGIIVDSKKMWDGAGASLLLLFAQESTGKEHLWQEQKTLPKPLPIWLRPWLKRWGFPFGMWSS
jgi:hypothetical protein